MISPMSLSVGASYWLLLCMICISTVSLAATEVYSANPDAASLLKAGNYAASHTVRVEKASSSWTINRHGQRVPIVPGEGEDQPAAGAVFHLK